MKKIIFILAGLVLLATKIPAGEITTEISRVVVYEDRAMVTRSGETNISAGAGEVILGGLPPMIMDDSVRVSGKSAGKVTITGTEVRRSYLVNPRRKDVDKLEQRIKGLKEERSAIDDGLRSLAMEKNFIASIQSSVPEKISKEMLLTAPDPGQWNNVLDFIGQSSTEVFAKERKLKAEKKELNKKIKALEKELGEIQSFVSREAKEIAISVEAGKNTSLKVEVSYVIRGATWRPVYDARADHHGGTVELTYRAEVRQKTGEDWDDVKLALSTARPSIGGRPSELSPWYISIYTPPAPQRQRAYSFAKSAAPAAPMELAWDKYDGDSEGKEEDITFDAAEIARAGAAITFEIPREQVIPSDGTFHGMSVDQTEIKGDYSYITTPKLSEFAYLLARCENIAAYPLLAGKINLFLGPDFVGTSRLDTVAPGEKYDLYLGIDEDIKVKRELISEKTEKGGLFSSNTGYKNYHYRITLENFHKTAQKITVLDQIPVSRSTDITVERGKISPATIRIKDREEPGILSWKLELPPKVKKMINFEFTVEYPKDKEISGI
jgi:uncharacterized protein (TIGR02231 family)